MANRVLGHRQMISRLVSIGLLLLVGCTENTGHDPANDRNSGSFYGGMVGGGVR